MDDITYLKEQLSLPQSKPRALAITDWVGLDTDRLAAFMSLFLGDDYRTTQRAAWVLSFISERYPFLLEPWYGKMLKALRKPNQHPAIRRNVMRHFDQHGLPEEHLDELADLAFGYLSDLQEPIAVRIFSMGVAFKICQKIPELKPELRLLIEEYLPHGSAGFKNRAGKILKKL